MKFIQNLGRKPYNIELFDLSRCNSEHARHWFFNAIFNIDGEIINSLFKRIKSCYNNIKHYRSGII